MRLNLGIRRRLAPLLGNDRRKIELLNALLFSLPGTPVIYYGDEIGMGDNVYLGDRDGVRTPMQWSADRNAGFSPADPHRLYLPPIVGGPVPLRDGQRGEPAPRPGLVAVVDAPADRRAPAPPGARPSGDITFLEPDNHHVLAFLRHLDGEDPILVVANLSQRAQSVELDLRRFLGTTPVEVFGGSPFASVGEWPYYLTLTPVRLLLVPAHARSATPVADDGAYKPPVIEGSWPALIEGRAHGAGAGPAPLDPAPAVVRRQVPPDRQAPRRGGPAARGRRRISPLRLCTVGIEYVDGETDSYLVPLTVLDGDRARVVQHLPPRGGGGRPGRRPARSSTPSRTRRRSSSWCGR